MLNVIDCDVEHAQGVAFNMLFTVWRRRTLERSFRRCIVAAIELGRRYPEGVGVCHYLDADSLAPDADVRVAFADMLRLPCIRHYSVTYDASGFKAAAIRGVISGALTIGRPRFPHAVHVTLAAAGQWHAEQQAALGRPETASHVERAAHELRRIQHERFPMLPDTQAAPKSSAGGRASS